MRALEVIWALCFRELLRFVRERSAFYATLARPTLWLVVLGSGMQNAFRADTGVAYGAYLMPGVVAMTILFGGLFSGVSTVWDREFGFLKEVLVAPVSRLEIVLGKLLAGRAEARRARTTPSQVERPSSRRTFNRIEGLTRLPRAFMRAANAAHFAPSSFAVDCVLARWAA